MILLAVGGEMPFQFGNKNNGSFCFIVVVNSHPMLSEHFILNDAIPMICAICLLFSNEKRYRQVHRHIFHTLTTVDCLNGDCTLYNRINNNNSDNCSTAAPLYKPIAF